MFCSDCDYDLSHLDDLRCPECGRKFDPNDPTTYEQSDYRPCPVYLKFTLVLTFYPIIFLLSFYVAWAVGRLVLGHWPIAYVDEMGIRGSETIEAFRGLIIIIFMGTPFAFIITILLLIAGFINGFRKRSANPWLALYIAIWFIVAWAGTIQYLRYDPWRIVACFFD